MKMLPSAKTWRALRAAFRPLVDLPKYRISNCDPNSIQLPDQKSDAREVILIICGFGPERYQRATQRLVEQASRLRVFTRVIAFGAITEVPNLNPLRRRQIEALAASNPRGWGLWSWKPAVLDAVMSSLPEDAEVFYMDSGCEISALGGPVLETWRTTLRQQGHLFFTIPYMEREWTTREVLRYFGRPDDDETHQIQATWFGLINTAEWRGFTSAWSDACLIGDGALLREQDERWNPYLLEHREDQSVLSCMLKRKGGVKTLPHMDHFAPELYRPNSWILLMPIHTLRLASEVSKISPILEISTEGGCIEDLKTNAKKKSAYPVTSALTMSRDFSACVARALKSLWS